MPQRLGQIGIPAITILALAAIGAFGAPWTIRTCVALFAIAVATDALAHAWNGAMGRWPAYAWGALTSIAALMITRTLWFYAGLNLNGWGDAVPVIIVVIVTAFFQRLGIGKWGLEHRTSEQSSIPNSQSPISFLLPILSIAGLALVAIAASRAGTTATIRTPWPLLPAWTLPVIGVLFIAPLASAYRGAKRWIIAIESACAIASVAVIAPLVYAIGFGFDGFLHVAGERVLLETGTLSPKPMYYIGQYVTTTWIAKLADLDIGHVDRWLVPASAALLIPFALAASAKPRASALAAIIFLPLSFFVATTPNGFAMALAVIALVLTLGASRQTIPWTIPFIFAVWSALTHPLIGFPITTAIFAASIYASQDVEPSIAPPSEIHMAAPSHAPPSFVPHPEEKPAIVIAPLNRRSPLRIVSALIALASGFTVPIVFGLSATLGSQGTTFAVGKLADARAWAALANERMPWVANHYALWADASVWIERLLPLIALAFAVTGVIAARRHREGSRATVFLIASVSAAAAAAVLQLAGDFGFLIDYERGNYAARLWSVAFVLLLPAAIPAFESWADHLAGARTSSIIAAFAACGIIGAGSAYAALPRHDAVTPSRGWSVSQSDIDAVKFIDENSAGKPYTVLANQSVSAAAVRTFGFKRYNGDVFFYPIPTGGALYNVFLTASYGDPSRDTMKKAAELGGTDLVYFAVNNYWWKADELIEQASSSTDRMFIVNDGKVTVFKYEL